MNTETKEVFQTMKKLISILIAAVLALCAVSAVAETTLSVTGSGEVLMPADNAVVSLGVNVRDRDALQAQGKANEAIAAIRQALTDGGLAAEDVNTGYINLYAMYDYSSTGAETLSCYSASSTLQLRITDMGSIGKYIDLAFGAGANTLDGISFSASDDSAARAEALKAAYEDAKGKAEVLAVASGMKITGVSGIQESGVYAWDSGTNNLYAKAGGTMESAGRETVVQAAKICVSASVTVTFSAE